jgi:RimJ/RimL family protein N-acetyltransferase
MRDDADFTPLRTARLTLRRFRPEDLEAFLAYRNDPEVARYQGWPVPMDEAAGRAFIEEAAAAIISPAGGGGQVAVALAATNELLGDLYLGRFGGDPRQGMLGYSLARRHQGRGYAGEAARALLGYAFDTLGLHRMVATVDVRNTASVALLERLGMRREGHHLQCFYDERDGAWADEYAYALLRDEWRAQRNQAGDAQL